MKTTTFNRQKNNKNSFSSGENLAVENAIWLSLNLKKLEKSRISAENSWKTGKNRQKQRAIKRKNFKCLISLFSTKTLLQCSLCVCVCAPPPILLLFLILSITRRKLREQIDEITDNTSLDQTNRTFDTKFEEKVAKKYKKFKKMRWKNIKLNKYKRHSEIALSASLHFVYSLTLILWFILILMWEFQLFWAHNCSQIKAKHRKKVINRKKMICNFLPRMFYVLNCSWTDLSRQLLCLISSTLGVKKFFFKW